MRDKRTYHFVAAATVAAELHQATKVARDISITAGNAKALALRAGSSALGFRALTDFIDELALTTINTAKHVNELAVDISRQAALTNRSRDAIEHFQRAIRKADENSFRDSIKPALALTEQSEQETQSRFSAQVWKLKVELDELARELRSGAVLSAMSRVEATQVSKEHAVSLKVIADKVASATEKIRLHIQNSQRCFAEL